MSIAAELSGEISKDQDDLFSPGCFVMLHTSNSHPDAGRIGLIVQRNGVDILVEFFTDDLLGSTDYSLLPLQHWQLIPDFYIESYQPCAMKRGWRVTEQGLSMFRSLGWSHNSASLGKA